jgi:hypothetical protein
VDDDLALVEDLGRLGIEQQLPAQARALGERDADRLAAQAVAELAEELHAGDQRKRAEERRAQARRLGGLAQRVGDLDEDLAVGRLAAVADARAAARAPAGAGGSAARNARRCSSSSIRSPPPRGVRAGCAARGERASGPSRRGSPAPARSPRSAGRRRSA